MKKIVVGVGVLLLVSIGLFLIIGTPSKSEELYELDHQVKINKTMMSKCIATLKEITDIKDYDEIANNILDPINYPTNSKYMDNKLVILQNIKDLYLEKQC